MSTIHKHFRSAQTLSSFLTDNSNRIGSYYHENQVSDDPTKRPQGVELLRSGSIAIVEAARKQIKQYQQDIPSLRRRWRYDVVGTLPSVPRFLANHPQTMRRIEKEMSPKTPIRIWVGNTPASGLSEQQILARGTALVAFALAMSERRSVFITPYQNIYQSRNGENAFVSWDLRTSPMILAELASIGDPRVTRYAGIAATYIINPAMRHSAFDGATEAICRQIMKIKPDDIWLPPASYGDPLIDNPRQWIESAIAKYITKD